MVIKARLGDFRELKISVQVGAATMSARSCRLFQLADEHCVLKLT